MTATQVELEEGKCTGLLKNKHLDLEEGSLLIISCKIRWEVYRIQQKTRESHRWRSFFFFFSCCVCCVCELLSPIWLFAPPPHGLWPARLLCPWGSPSKNTRVGCHVFLQEIFPTQRLNLGLLHWRQILYCLSPLGSPPPLFFSCY